MKSKIVLLGLTALGLSALTATACIIEGTVTCPNGTTDKRIRVYLTSGPSTYTNPKGFYQLVGGSGPNTVCIDTKSLNNKFTVVGSPCQDVIGNPNDIAIANFTLTGASCATPPPQGLCWLTGGGTIGADPGTPNFTYGGVVNPGCSPTAAGGGNFNVLDHVTGVHFKGLTITVTGCSGVSDKAPPVPVNIIDFSGSGVIGPLGNEATPVTFKARAIDNGEPGGGADQLYLEVVDGTGAVVLLISTDATNPDVVNPVTVSTGNLQIHTSSCN